MRKRASISILVLAWFLMPIYFLGSLATEEPHVPPAPSIPKEARERVAMEICTIWIKGDKEMETHDYDEARQYYFKAYELARDIGDYLGVALSAEYIGSTYEKQGLFDDALEWYKEALAAYTHVKDPESFILSGHTILKIALLFNMLGQGNEVVEVCEKGITGLEKALYRISGLSACWTYQILAYLHRELGTAYRKQGSDEAIEAYSKSLDRSSLAAKCYEKLGQKEEAAFCRQFSFILAWHLGDTCYFFNEFERGLSAYKLALALWQHPDVYVKNTCLEVELLFGATYGALKLGKVEEALQFTGKAKGICERLKCEEEWDKKITDLAFVVSWELYEKQEYQEALYWLLNVAEAYERLGLSSETGVSLYGVGVCYGRLRFFEKAIGALEEALDILEQTGPHDAAQQAAEWLRYCRCSLTSGLKESGPLRLVTSCMTHDIDESGCPTDEGRVFFTTDEKAVCWVVLEGRGAGHRLKFEFHAPDGSLYYWDEVDVEWPLHWYWIWIRGYQAEFLTGLWVSKIYLDGRLVAQHEWRLERP